MFDFDTQSAQHRLQAPANFGQQNRKVEDLSCQNWPEHRPSGPVAAKRGLEPFTGLVLSTDDWWTEL
jgi:hypothetical protein